MTPHYCVNEIRKILIALLDVFNNLRVNKYTDAARQNYDRTVSIPIVTHSSANFANWVSTTMTKQKLMQVPIAGLRYVGNAPDDPHRTQPTYAREMYYAEQDFWIRDIQPTPFVFKFELEILCDNLDELWEVKENIEPYFNTYRTLRIKEFDFAPTFERQIPFTIGVPTDQIDDEKQNTSNEYQFYRVKYNIEAHGVMHRPYEIPAVIKYAQMDYIYDNKMIDSLQVFVYPDEIARQKKHLWETIAPSIRDGYSLLKTMTRTLVKRASTDGEEYWKDVSLQNIFLTDPEVLKYANNGQPVAGLNPILIGYRKDADGKYILDADGDKIPIYNWEEVIVDDVERPVEVPSFDLLHLKFDEDTPFESDFSGLGRDFVAIKDESRKFVPDIPPGNGNNAPGGYAFNGDKDWSQILNWFGDNREGTIESSYTFKATLQFTEQGDTIFQYLYNPEDVKLKDGTIIKAGEVWFDWGIMDNRLYFTYHTSSQFKTFRSEEFRFDNETIYSFYFVLYNSGANGQFGIKTNLNDTMVAIPTAEDKDG